MLDWTPRRMRLLQALIIFVAAFIAAPLFAGTVTLRVDWPKPTHDGGVPITDTENLSIRVYESKEGGPYVARALAKWAPATRVTLTSSNTRPFCWRVSAVYDGKESGQTKEACAHYFPDDICVTPKPLDATQPGVCPAGTKGAWTQTSASVVASFPTCWSPGPYLPTSPPAGACVPIAPGSPPTPTVERP